MIKFDNTKALRLAGGMLFTLGLAGFFLSYFSNDVSADRIRMVLSTALLLSLGYPALLYVRSLKQIETLEQRVSELEKRGKS